MNAISRRINRILETDTLPLGGWGARSRYRVPASARGAGVHRLDPAGGVPEALGLGIGLHQGEVLFVATGEAHVVDGDLVDREHGAGRPVLRAHVADGGAGR